VGDKTYTQKFERKTIKFDQDDMVGRDGKSESENPRCLSLVILWAFLVNSLYQLTNALNKIR